MCERPCPTIFSSSRVLTSWYTKHSCVGWHDILHTSWPEQLWLCNRVPSKSRSKDADADCPTPQQILAFEQITESFVDQFWNHFWYPLAASEIWIYRVLDLRWLPSPVLARKESMTVPLPSKYYTSVNSTGSSVGHRKFSRSDQSDPILLISKRQQPIPKDHLRLRGSFARIAENTNGGS